MGSFRENIKIRVNLLNEEMEVNVHKMGKGRGRKQACLPRTSPYTEVKETTAETR